MKTGNDPYTGEVFIKTRSNQVFANRRNQVAYNNRKARLRRESKGEIAKILEKNYAIMENSLGDMSTVRLSMDYLKGAGFHFGCFTHNISKDDLIWSCVFDHCYRKVGEEIIIQKTK